MDAPRTPPSPAYHVRAVALPDLRGADAPTDLWIVDGRITFAPQRDATPLAPRCRFVLPGLVDCHTHIDFADHDVTPGGTLARIEENRRRHLDAGTVLLRDMGATSNLTLALGDAARAPAALDGDAAAEALPRVHAAGLCIIEESRAPFVPTPPGRLVEAARAQARAGARWVKVFADWPGWPMPEREPAFGRDHLSYPVAELADAVAAAHEAGARLAAHAFGREGAAACVAAGVDSIEHGWGLDEAMLDAMASRRTGWTPMLALAPSMARDAEKQRDPERGRWVRERVARMRELLPRARRLGVPVLAGTDWFPTVTLAHEVAALRDAGLDPDAALAAATTTARAFLGEPALDEGAPADLVLYERDPREAPDALTRPDVVVLAGRVVRAREGRP